LVITFIVRINRAQTIAQSLHGLLEEYRQNKNKQKLKTVRVNCQSGKSNAPSSIGMVC